jgi:glycosyltransferase involved in cell wall biosynthesis
MAADRVICMAGHRMYTEDQGGVEYQIKYIGRALADDGWRVSFLSPSSRGRAGREVLEDNIDVWWYPHFSFIFQAPRRSIEKMLDEIEPAIFYQRGRSQLASSGIILNYSKSRGIPLVFAFSSDRDTDRFFQLREMLASNKSIWGKALLIPYMLVLDRALYRMLKEVEHLVVQHREQAARLGGKLGRNSVLLPNLQVETDKEIQKPAKKTVLWVSNYRPMKQGEVFIRLAEALVSEELRFIMVCGRTKKEYLDPLLKTAGSLTNIEVFEELPHDRVEKLMEEAALFVNTSEEQEGFPNTFIQSWLRETPVVSLKVDPGGVLTGEGMGICSGRFDHLVEDVRRLLNGDEERLAMGKRARIYAEREHGFRNNRQRIVDFFNQVAASGLPR